jgi:glycosyltransferase involved in cell wall biosynthesis
VANTSPAATTNGALISCIIPTYNGERYLREAVDSILAQDYRPLEIIVADDGSTDGSFAIASSYGERVRYVEQPNQGPAAARNLGLTVARGEFVAFLDQDDRWHPEKLNRQIARFDARPGLDVSITHMRLFWDDAVRVEEESFRQAGGKVEIPGYITGTILARRGLFERVGGFDSALRHGDAMGWFLRAREQGAQVELLPDVLLYHRIHQSNLSRREITVSRDEFLGILKASLDRKRQRDDSTAP